MAVFDINQLAPELNRRLNSVVKKSIEKTAMQAIENTPVKTGFAKASWKLSTQSSEENADTTLLNNAPYIEFVEAENRMLASAVQNFDLIVNAEANKVNN